MKAPTVDVGAGGVACDVNSDSLVFFSTIGKSAVTSLSRNPPSLRFLGDQSDAKSSPLAELIKE